MTDERLHHASTATSCKNSQFMVFERNQLFNCSICAYRSSSWLRKLASCRQAPVLILQTSCANMKILSLNCERLRVNGLLKTLKSKMCGCV